MNRNDPAAMSIDQRLDEIAALLATGFLRLKCRTGCLPPATSERADGSKNPTKPPLPSSEILGPV
ncbi:MAG: hypothetical protein IT442_18150 [Phycisphaeraceae bacterium]|nr:hypothetical protein [Phycisphaeraceae bacterium]